MCDTCSGQGDEAGAGGTACVNCLLTYTLGAEGGGSARGSLRPGCLYTRGACTGDLVQPFSGGGEIGRTGGGDGTGKKVAVPPPSIQLPGAFIGTELESPQGPLEYCAQEGGEAAGLVTNPASKSLADKPAWDMDTLKRAVAAAKTGLGEVARIVEGCTFKPREQAFTALINMCGQARDWRKAVEVFEAMKRIRCVRPNTYTYSALIAACSNAGEWQRALEFFEVMKSAAKCDSNCEPNEVTYSSLITACERGGVFGKALEVYDAMLQAGIPGDHISFSSALSACEKSGNMARAKEILEEMHRRGFVATLAIYKEIMLDYAENGDWDKALDMCLTMQMVGQDPNEGTRKRRGKKKTAPSSPQGGGQYPIRRPTPSPVPGAVEKGTTSGKNTSAKPAWDMETLKRAIVQARLGSGEVRRVIESCTFRPREQAFTALINLCGRLRDWKKAVEVFEAMKQLKGVRPNTYTYSALIAACSSAGEWEKALEIFDVMKDAAKSDSNCHPNEVTYSALITACQRGGMFDKALELYDETLSAGVPADQITFSSALAACEKSERWDKAEEILEDMHARGLIGNPSVYCELIHNRAENGEWSCALDVFLGMQMAGAEPDSNTCKALMKALEKGGQPEMVLELFNSMRESAIAIDTDMYNTAMRATLHIDSKRVASGVVPCPPPALGIGLAYGTDPPVLRPAQRSSTGGGLVSKTRGLSGHPPRVPQLEPKKAGVSMPFHPAFRQGSQMDTMHLPLHPPLSRAPALGPCNLGLGPQHFVGVEHVPKVERVAVHHR